MKLIEKNPEPSYLLQHRQLVRLVLARGLAYLGSMTAKIRLYVDHPLGEGQLVPLTRDQAHYLFGVMRQGLGAELLLFNGRDGEWLAEVSEANKRNGVLIVTRQTKPLQMPPDLWLCFSPIKKARTDFIVEKTVELGAARIMPVQTAYLFSLVLSLVVMLGFAWFFKFSRMGLAMRATAFGEMT